MNEEAMTPDKEQVVEPLSDLQLAALRDVIREKSANGGTISARNAERLLATLDAARTASVAGLDRERLAAAIWDALGWQARYRPGRDTTPYCPTCGHGDFATYDPIPQGLVSGDADHADWLTLADAIIASLSAPSIEQEPGEAPWLVGHEECAREADRLRGVIAALREQEPGETLRAADERYRVSAAGLAEAICAERNPRVPEGEPVPVDDECRAFARRVVARLVAGRAIAALEADSNPQETER